MQLTYVVGLCALFTFISCTQARKCYTCDKEDLCSDKFDTTTQAAKNVVCEVTTPKCKKEKFKTTADMNKVKRSCETTCDEKDDATSMVTCCDADGCNTATSLATGLTGIILATFSAVLVY